MTKAVPALLIVSAVIAVLRLDCLPCSTTALHRELLHPVHRSGLDRVGNSYRFVATAAPDFESAGHQ